MRPACMSDGAMDSLGCSIWNTALTGNWETITEIGPPRNPAKCGLYVCTCLPLRRDRRRGAEAKQEIIKS